MRGVGAGWRNGFVIGIVLWEALVLGLYSISTAGVPLLVGWWLGQAVELGVAGGVIGGLAAGVSFRRMLVWVTLIVFVLTVALQSLGIAPAMRVAETHEARPNKLQCGCGVAGDVRLRDPAVEAEAAQHSVAADSPRSHSLGAGGDIVN